MDSKLTLIFVCSEYFVVPNPQSFYRTTEDTKDTEGSEQSLVPRSRFGPFFTWHTASKRYFRCAFWLQWPATSDR